MPVGTEQAGPPHRPVPLVDDAPALSNVAWSSAMVGQSLEALFTYLGPDGPHLLHPIHAETLRLGWRPDQQPGEIIVAAAERYGLAPILVHSTSWRFEEGRVVLTYLCAVVTPVALNEHLADELASRSDLARGDAMGPPVEIRVAQVVEHAFRHLAWLVKDDQAVHDALPDWVAFLADFQPEPFRAFGVPAGPPGGMHGERWSARTKR